MLMTANSDVEIWAICLFTVFSMSFPDGTIVYGPRGGKFKGIVGVAG